MDGHTVNVGDIMHGFMNFTLIVMLYYTSYALACYLVHTPRTSLFIAL